MSVVKRISDRTDEYVCNNKLEGESWSEALERLLGFEDVVLTEERVEDIVEQKIEEMRYR